MGFKIIKPDPKPEPRPEPRHPEKPRRKHQTKNPLYSKYLANVFENVKNRPSRFVTALGVIFAKNETQALTQARTLHTCKPGQVIEVQEALDPLY